MKFAFAIIAAFFDLARREPTGQHQEILDPNGRLGVIVHNTDLPPLLLDLSWAVKTAFDATPIELNDMAHPLFEHLATYFPGDDETFFHKLPAGSLEKAEDTCAKYELALPSGMLFKCYLQILLRQPKAFSAQEKSLLIEQVECLHALNAMISGRATAPADFRTCIDKAARLEDDDIRACAIQVMVSCSTKSFQDALIDSWKHGGQHVKEADWVLAAIAAYLPQHGEEGSTLLKAAVEHGVMPQHGTTKAYAALLACHCHAMDAPPLFGKKKMQQQIDCITQWLHEALGDIFEVGRSRQAQGRPFCWKGDLPRRFAACYEAANELRTLGAPLNKDAVKRRQVVQQLFIGALMYQDETHAQLWIPTLNTSKNYWTAEFGQAITEQLKKMEMTLSFAEDAARLYTLHADIFSLDEATAAVAQKIAAILIGKQDEGSLKAAHLLLKRYQVIDSATWLALAEAGRPHKDANPEWFAQLFHSLPPLDEKSLADYLCWGRSIAPLLPAEALDQYLRATVRTLPEDRSRVLLVEVMRNCLKRAMSLPPAEQLPAKRRIFNLQYAVEEYPTNRQQSSVQHMLKTAFARAAIPQTVMYECSKVTGAAKEPKIAIGYLNNLHNYLQHRQISQRDKELLEGIYKLMAKRGIDNYDRLSAALFWAAQGTPEDDGRAAEQLHGFAMYNAATARPFPKDPVTQVINRLLSKPTLNKPMAEALLLCINVPAFFSHFMAGTVHQWRVICEQHNALTNAHEQMAQAADTPAALYTALNDHLLLLNRLEMHPMYSKEIEFIIERLAASPPDEMTYSLYLKLVRDIQSAIYKHSGDMPEAGDLSARLFLKLADQILVDPALAGVPPTYYDLQARLISSPFVGKDQLTAIICRFLLFPRHVTQAERHHVLNMLRKNRHYQVSNQDLQYSLLSLMIKGTAPVRTMKLNTDKISEISTKIFSQIEQPGLHEEVRQQLNATRITINRTLDKLQLQLQFFELRDKLNSPIPLQRPPQFSSSLTGRLFCIYNRLQREFIPPSITLGNLMIKLGKDVTFMNEFATQFHATLRQALFEDVCLPIPTPQPISPPNKQSGAFASSKRPSSGKRTVNSFSLRRPPNIQLLNDYRWITLNMLFLKNSGELIAPIQALVETWLDAGRCLPPAAERTVHEHKLSENIDKIRAAYTIYVQERRVQIASIHAQRGPLADLLETSQLSKHRPAAGSPPPIATVQGPNP